MPLDCLQVGFDGCLSTATLWIRAKSATANNGRSACRAAMEYCAAGAAGASATGSPWSAR
eukprot:4844269-Pyramimonas_sp.AAC.1